ncbi:hypothetical protein SGFS_065500 [Streptomyces graminofaciens]|uniref:Uncharacterized protein n=1 Tax=Streptomyces graminofaciens TaxID=68212 RepID=A0ABM7FFS7_9ACTN|nr:DUF6221 family protein [Streptomyces graminofaciens]BBC35256.1 hypothetical protein SGFS_065500 [Streptomyces graminofaciens]
MVDLARWLGQQLDVDAERATAAADNDSGEWFMGDKWNVYRAEDEAPDEDVETNALVVYGNVKSQSEHIAEWDPARVLREIDAKRRLLDEHEATGLKGCAACGFTLEYMGHGPWCTTLRLLALPYADRDGYREEWSP